MSIYRKYYADNGVVAYAPQGDVSDLLFVFGSADPQAEKDVLELPVLVSRWNGVTAKKAATKRTNSVRPRSLYFCQKFGLKTLKAPMDRLCNFGVGTWWGKLVYWRSEVFEGKSPDIAFPQGPSASIDTGDLHIAVEGNSPTSLDDFTITLDDSGSRLLLKVGADCVCRVRNRNDVIGTSNTNQLFLDIQPQPEQALVSGAVSTTLDWPNDRKEVHPVRLAGFVFQADPSKPPPPGGDPVTCPSWRAELADEFTPGRDSSCTVALDPRDHHKLGPWVNADFNSRIHFGAARLHSSFFGSNGQRLHLQAGKGGLARLGFLNTRMAHDGSVTSRGDVIFHPEGQFLIASPTRARRARKKVANTGIGDWDLIAGAASTEFFDIAAANCVEFVKGQPAFFVKGEESHPIAARTILKDRPGPADKGGKVITSFVRFTRATSAMGVPYHTGNANAPLFESQLKDHLTRRRMSIGDVPTLGMPVFPMAGFKATGDPAPMLHYEATHLAPWRSKNVVRPTLKRTAAEATRGVTPQGLMAEVTPEGYTRLFFGNPDSANAARAQFSITIADQNHEIFNEVQQTLAGSQLFLVFDRPDGDALRVIHADATVYIRDFSFSVNLQPNAKAEATPTDTKSVLIVKYFKNQSLQDLINDRSKWGLLSHLAPNLDAPARISNLTHFGSDPNKDIPQDLKDIWSDPNWQGVILLNLPVDAMPNLLEALRPGIVGQLCVHHFGLNFLPVRAVDLKTEPLRLGSAFGLVHYEKPPDQDPTAPVTTDQEPGESPGPGDRAYSFVVNHLDIGFKNSQIASFQANVDVTFSHLFWDKSSITAKVRRKSPGKKPRIRFQAAPLTLIGSYERRVKPGNATEDVFSLKTTAEYVITFEKSSYLESLGIKRGQLSIISAKRSQDNTNTLLSLSAFIGFDADLTLREENLSLPLFKVKALHLTSFGLQFGFIPKPVQTEKRFTFGLKADGIAADIEFDPPSGAGSVLSLLPLKLKGMAVAIGKLLAFNDIGFQPIGSIGSTFHFGFVLELDLGFLGKLAGDLRGLKFPLILGWRGGKTKGLAFGVQFPTFDGKIDIGIQQFIRFRAQRLELKRCPERGAAIEVLAIHAVDAKLVMFGREFPDASTSFVIFVPVHPSRKASWAFGVAPGGALKYLGGGHRINLPKENAIDTKAVVQQFRDALEIGPDICALKDFKQPDADGWTVVGHLSAGLEVWLAVSDAPVPIYGLTLNLPALGEVDVLYRRINDQLGIFSAEVTLPESLRKIQVGAATLTLPTFRIEVHTDGGFLFDVGFPWKNDFARSCQVEIAIFLGSGGFYYGRTSAAAADLLSFNGGYGYTPPDPDQLTKFKALRMGFAARVGLGRSFSIGILNAEASITIFGGIEGAAAYPDGGGSLLEPSLYALNGYVGLMIDIRASVDFAIIRASARILIYSMVGLELRRVLAKSGQGHWYLKLPLVLYAQVGVTVSVDVEISIGCVSITIHLSFSTTWTLQETLGSLHAEPALRNTRGKKRRLRGMASSSPWNPDYRYWKDLRDLNIFVTVLPCMANATDVGESGDYGTCAIGQMLLRVHSESYGFADLAQFLIGWVVRPDTTSGIPGDAPISLALIGDLRSKIRDPQFWDGFQPALVTVLKNQFKPVIGNVSKANENDPFAVIPFWPGTTFQYVPKVANRTPIQAAPTFVTEQGVPLRADDAAFSNYARCLISGMLAEIEQLVTQKGVSPDPGGEPAPNAPAKALSWSTIWQEMFKLDPPNERN